MKDDWKHYETKLEKGPKSATKVVMLGFFVLFGIGIVVSATGYVFGWFSEAANVAKQEFGPRAALQKYEWFKDASAQLDKKVADIEVYKTQLNSINPDRMSRTQQEQYMLWKREVAGVTASYNSLAAEWNSQISKFNWRPFLASLPNGATELLTKEYTPYKLN